MADGQARNQILVVDDEAVIVDAARKMLGVEGFAVRTAEDASAAIQQLRAGVTDIALLDLMLPGVSGMDLLRIIQRDYPETVVVMMTGYSTLTNAIAFLKSGALDFLPKPFSFEELVSTVRRASRFLQIQDVPAVSDSASRLFRLGIGTWAQTGPDNTARLGITETYRQMVGPVEQIEFPTVNTQVYQGGPLAQVVAQDQLKHTVWSALSGRVESINPDAEVHLKSPAPDVLQGWLVRIVPDRLQSELINLSSSVLEESGEKRPRQ